jgi:hypothetical protein
VPHDTIELVSMRDQHNIVMGARPYRAAPDAPNVDDVADQIDRLCIMASEKFEQCVGPARARRKMHI